MESTTRRLHSVFSFCGRAFFCLTLRGGHLEAIGAVGNFVVGGLRALRKKAIVYASVPVAQNSRKWSEFCTHVVGRGLAFFCRGDGQVFFFRDAAGVV